eukprot:6175025-Pleurochrysis_carterae.AAC.2
MKKASFDRRTAYTGHASRNARRGFTTHQQRVIAFVAFIVETLPDSWRPPALVVFPYSSSMAPRRSAEDKSNIFNHKTQTRVHSSPAVEPKDSPSYAITSGGVGTAAHLLHNCVHVPSLAAKRPNGQRRHAWL